MLHVAQLRCRHPKNSSKTQGLPIAHGYSPAKDFSFFSIANREACNWIRRKKFYTCSIGGNFDMVSSSFFCEIVRYGGSSAGASSVDRYAQERGSYASDRQDRGGYESGSSSGYGGSDRGYGAPDRGYGPPPDRGYGPPPERSRAGYGPPSDRPYSAGSYSSGGLLNISYPWLLFHLWKGRKTRSSLFVLYLSRRVECLTLLARLSTVLTHCNVWVKACFPHDAHN